jgi:hypothetical protein
VICYHYFILLILLKNYFLLISDSSKIASNTDTAKMVFPEEDNKQFSKRLRFVTEPYTALGIYRVLRYEGREGVKKPIFVLRNLRTFS